MANVWMNERLRQYLAAEKAVLIGGQSYRIGNRTLTRADLAEIRSEIKSLVAAGAVADEGLQTRGRRIVRFILHD